LKREITNHENIVVANINVRNGVLFQYSAELQFVDRSQDPSMMKLIIGDDNRRFWNTGET